MRQRALVRRWSKYALLWTSDANNVYVVTGDDVQDSSSVIVFARVPDGRLSRLPGPTGCVASIALADCAVQPELTAHDRSITPDGAHVYVGGGPTLSAFARDVTGGALVASSCRSTRRVPGCEPAAIGFHAPAWSRDGRLGFAVAGVKAG